MPKISALPPMVTADAADEAPIVDTSAGSTKKWTLTLLKSYLQSLVAWITHAMVADGFTVQTVATNYTAVATGATTIPQDDTIPQITEGNEFMTQAITPKSATNILIIEIVALVSCDTAGRNAIGALFQDAVANGIAVNLEYNDNASSFVPTIITLRHSVVAGNTTARTYRFRVGGQAAGTVTFNGVNAVRVFGAITKSNITIREIKAS